MCNDKRVHVRNEDCTTKQSSVLLGQYSNGDIVQNRDRIITIGR